MKDINVVFLNYFCKDDILNAVDSLTKDIVGCPFSIQITVADNSENKDAIKEDLVVRFPNVVYVNTGGNIGFGAGNTVGFKVGEARYYFALNRDTIIPENSKTIERIVRFMDEHPRIGAIGPKLLNLDGSLQYTCYRFDLRSSSSNPQTNQWDKNTTWPVNTPTVCS